ncbi:hypothetical protein AVEN_102431-1 [Araneus ventricosus]|uniref:Uncharacterized protein n=1 Tax=Araneus ventricosus TaxID=182803 RepID=A0A4Y2XD99_ARAVE|nr:hypothetical protein AVEN_102431-1 [Araneus ventricosus]
MFWHGDTPQGIHSTFWSGTAMDASTFSAPVNGFRYKDFFMCVAGHHRFKTHGDSALLAVAPDGIVYPGTLLTNRTPARIQMEKQWTSS